jgi:hypothetical protein
MVPTSPDRAGGLLRDAERAAARLSTTDRDTARADIAVVTALLDPDPSRARQIALSITDPARCAETLAAIARPKAGGSDTDKRDVLAMAADKAGQVTDPEERAKLMTTIGAKLAAHDEDEARHIIDHAERIARDIPTTRNSDDALASVSRNIFADDPERAERIALAIEYPADRLDRLISLAALHKSEPKRT